MMKIIYIAILALTLQGCCTLFGLNCAQVTQYPISGTVTLIQECVQDDPAIITINFTLIKGSQEVGKTISVPLVNGVGTYNTSVGFVGQPSSWKRVTSDDVCGGLICTHGDCADMATGTAGFPVGNPTIHDVRFTCVCL